MRCTSYMFMFLWIVTAGLAQNKIDIPDTGWRLWPDTAAAWKNDTIFLPEEVNLKTLPVNPPTGGWDMLNTSQGIEVTLPSTVEEHYWGDFGFRPYQNEYYFERDDNQVKNGNYLGVSWWWREVEVPENFEGKKVILHIRGARLRAEVYLNRQLVGYHIITETAFNCEVSDAIRPGETNLLAIRITNPGGRLDWVDTKLMPWGDVQFHASHGFGGLDRGIYLSAHDPLYIKDLWVLNTPNIRTIQAHAQLQNDSDKKVNGTIRFQIFDPDKNTKPLVSVDKGFIIEASSEQRLTQEITYDDARLWNLNTPKRYQLRASVTANSPGKSGKWTDKKQRMFGFRWFEADGVGENALLRLNGKRIRLISAISWGFWGYNGLWPRPELAEKEVKAAKAFGMNCIQFHRNIGKAEVLEAQDRLGLLRFMEPGGGQTALGEKYSLYADSPDTVIDTSGKNGDPSTFAEKYMEEKIIRMVRDHRSHPSLVIYCIQNEINPDLRNPRIFRLLRRMHREDPSRIVVLKSGIPPRNQAWMQPFDETVYHDQGTGYSGWWDRHTVGGPGVWQDAMYQNPEDFTHRSVNDSEIVVWGEMLGAAVPDNHARMVREIEANGGESYDLRDHRQILNAYQKFLDKWRFRSAFPTAEALFLDIGDKSYDFWGRVIESARLAEANDFLVISGWESTAIENHSGLLDNLRGFKGNPQLLKKRFASVRPVIKARTLVIPPGKADTLDLFVLNESGAPVGKSARLTMMDPSGKTSIIGTYKLPAWAKDRFVYPAAEAVATPKLTIEGAYSFRFQITENPEFFSEEKILVVDPLATAGVPGKIGVLSHTPKLAAVLNTLPGVTAETYRKNGKYEAIIATTRLLYGWRSVVDSTTEILNTDDDRLFHTESWGYWKNLEYIFTELPKGKAKVTLYFAEVTLKNPGDRIMNVAINGDTVLKDFDIVATVGGPNSALDTTFMVAAPQGVVKITVPKLTVNYAKFSAIKVEAGDTVIAINAGGDRYVDKNGLVWKPYGQEINLDEAVLQRVKSGTPLLCLPDGHEAARTYAKTLGEAGAYQYKGDVGNVRASWMGSWYFVREHPVFAGLPVNQAMKSYYQVPVGGSDGFLLDGDNVEVFVGYGRDHDRNIGAAGFTATLGKGRILFFSLPGMVQGLTGQAGGMHPVMLKRLIMNSLSYLNKTKNKSNPTH